MQGFALVLLVCGIAAAQDAPRKPTSEARGILRVTADPGSGLADNNLLAVMVMSPSVAREARGRVWKELNLAPLPAENSIEVSAFPGANFTIPQMGIPLTPKRPGIGMVDVVVQSYDERVPAAKLLAALELALQSRLSELDGRDSGEAALQEARKRLLELRETLMKERDALATLASIHKVEIDAALAAQKRLRLETELQGLTVQLAGLKARQAVIEKQIAELGNVKAEGAQDAVIAEQLRLSIEARRKIVQIQMAALNAGRAGASDEAVQKAKDELAQAETDLARYRRSAIDAASGGRIAQLKMRLDDTAIEIAEVEVRRDALQQFAAAGTSSSDVEMKRIELELLEREYRQRSEEFSQLQAELRRHVSPRVTVISLE
jgi:hypothetical protein